jgi:hypothetical protein
MQRAQRSQSIISSVSLQDSQLQFYDAIEYFTSDSESEDESDQESDLEANEANVTGLNKSNASAIVPGINAVLLNICLEIRLFLVFNTLEKLQSILKILKLAFFFLV